MDQSFTDRILTTVSDKRQCYSHEVVINTCGIVDERRVLDIASAFRLIGTNVGFSSLAVLSDGGLVVGFFQRTIDDEPGPRVYGITPGDCSAGNPPVIDSFLGFYKFSHKANRVATAASIPGSSSRVLVLEHDANADSNKIQKSSEPTDKICILDVTNMDAPKDSKLCILNLRHISDPDDVDSDEKKTSRVFPGYSGLVVIDNHCLILAWDRGVEFSVDEVSFYTELIQDTHFYKVCYYEPIFHASYDFKKLP